MGKELIEIVAKTKYLAVTWQVNNYCNFKCSYCNPGNWSGTDANNGNLSTYLYNLDTIISKYKDEGYIETPMFGRKLFKSFFGDMNAAKLLNYLLQSYETERNMAVIHNILLRTKAYSSKLILYTYDSFLYDFDKRDGATLVNLIKEELEQNGKFPVKIEIGPDYHNMISAKKH